MSIICPPEGPLDLYCTVLARLSLQSGVVISWEVAGFFFFKTLCVQLRSKD